MKPLGRLFDTITAPALKGKGRTWMLLRAHWREIAGDVAEFTEPLKLDRSRDARGAVLKLRVRPGRALEVQHMQEQLIARINAFFGHGAVASLRFVQAPFSDEAASSTRDGRSRTREACVDPVAAERLNRRITGIGDPELAESLRRLARGIAAGKAESTHRNGR